MIRMRMMGQRLELRVLTLIAALALLLVGLNASAGAITDGEVQSSIERRLDMDSRLDATHIGVSVDRGHVVLTGTVGTVKEKKMAALVASSVIGVQSIINDILIEPSMTADQKVANAIKHSLLIVQGGSDHNISVHVDDGVVLLQGTVLSQGDRRAARDIAEAMPGVREVRDAIEVVGKQRPDEEIRNDVIEYLLYSPLVDDDKISVQVDNGAVTLTGTIQHLVHRDALAIDIENVHGVEEVKAGKLIPEGLSASAQNLAKTDD